VPGEVGVQLTPELSVGDAWRTSANVSKDSSHTNSNLNINQHSALRTAHMRVCASLTYTHRLIVCRNYNIAILSFVCYFIKLIDVDLYVCDYTL